MTAHDEALARIQRETGRIRRRVTARIRLDRMRDEWWGRWWPVRAWRALRDGMAI